MTVSDAVLWLYGLCCWGASLNFPAWTKLVFREMTPPRIKPWHRDLRFMHRVGLMILSLGIAGLSGTRFFGALESGEPITIPTIWAVMFIALMACAEPFFLRIDEIHARDRGGKSIGWRLYWIGVVVGTALLVVMRMA